jgi:hypothetical protein
MVKISEVQSTPVAEVCGHQIHQVTFPFGGVRFTIGTRAFLNGAEACAWAFNNHIEDALAA